MPSPQIYEYRNKCEFTCGYRHVQVQGEESVDKDTLVDGCGDTKDTTFDSEPEEIHKDPESNNDNAYNTIKKIPAAGFLAQGWQGGVYSPHCLQNVPDWACAIADILNEYLPTSPMTPYDSKVHRGFFRSFTIRCSLRTRECMVIVLHAPAKGGVGAKEDGSDDYSDVFEAEKERLVGMLTKDVLAVPKREFPEGHVRAVRNDGSEGIRVTSIYFQEYEGLSQPGPDHPVQVRVLRLCSADFTLLSNLSKQPFKACVWQDMPGREARAVYFPNLTRSILPDEYGRRRETLWYSRR